MPRTSTVIIESDSASPTGYVLLWGDYRDNFGTPESIELFKPVRSFRFVCIHGDYVARQETRAGRAYWYGYKRFGSLVRKVYLGKHHRISLHTLEAAAAALYGKEDVTQSSAQN